MFILRPALIFIIFSCINAVQSYACSVCFYGEPNNSANVALRMGVLTLFGILLGVLALFIKFFLSVRKRAQNLTQ